MNQQEPYLTGRPIPPHLQQHDVVGDSPLNPDYMEHEYVPQPTAWQSVPGAIRFAVWLWAIAMIVGFAVAVTAGVASLVGMMG